MCSSGLTNEADATPPYIRAIRKGPLGQSAWAAAAEFQRERTDIISRQVFGDFGAGILQTGQYRLANPEN